MRRRIYRYIVDQPGRYLREIQRAMGMGMGTLEHHLEIPCASRLDHLIARREQEVLPGRHEPGEAAPRTRSTGGPPPGHAHPSRERPHEAGRDCGGSGGDPFDAQLSLHKLRDYGHPFSLAHRARKLLRSREPPSHRPLAHRPPGLACSVAWSTDSWTGSNDSSPRRSICRAGWSTCEDTFPGGRGNGRARQQWRRSCCARRCGRSGCPAWRRASRR